MRLIIAIFKLALLIVALTVVRKVVFLKKMKKSIRLAYGLHMFLLLTTLLQDAVLMYNYYFVKDETVGQPDQT